MGLLRQIGAWNFQAKAKNDTGRPPRPHSALRAIALTGAAIAALVMALMMAAIAR